MLVLFAYSGNGGIPGTIPALVWWVAKTYLKIKTDERVDKVAFLELCDTPITMTRNRAIAAAQAGGFDMVLMLDSDNQPDGYLVADSEAKPFWETAFDLAYNRLVQGKPTVAMAPYCGPPQHPVKPNLGEVPYMFQWTNDATDDPVDRPKLVMLGRDEAAIRRGIEPIAAGPTGVSLFTTNAFAGLPQPYFDYDMNPEGTEKQSTEDVYCTRNISLFWLMTTGENPVFALWDCWALHHKIKLVGRPTRMPIEAVAKQMAEAVKTGWSLLESHRDLDFDRPPEPVSADEAKRIVELAREAMHGDPPPVEEPEEAPDDEADVYEDATLLARNGNGYVEHNSLAIVPRMIGRRKVFSVGQPIPMEDIAAIQQLAKSAVKDRAVLVHPWSGEVAAALLGSMPAKAELFLIDSPQPNKIALSSFVQSLGLDFESGRLKGVGKKDALDLDPQDLDLVFLATSPLEKLTPELLESWLVHVSPSGALAGMGCTDADEEGQKVVLDFAGQYGISPRVVSGSSVWIIPKAQILAVSAGQSGNDPEEERDAGHRS